MLRKCDKKPARNAIKKISLLLQSQFSEQKQLRKE